MRIYTKTGDTGKTGLYRGERVRKDDIRITALGTIDELNCHLGVCHVAAMGWTRETLEAIQGHLLRMGGDIATDGTEPIIGGKNNQFARINTADAAWLEHRIDLLETKLPPLQTFILPGGSRAGAELHLARAVCRRAERCVVKLQFDYNRYQDILIYLNRLSDFLFMLARHVNLLLNDAPEQPWVTGIASDS